MMRKKVGRKRNSLPAAAALLLLLLPLLLTTPVQARAYTDPGTGAFLYQAAYAAFLGGSFYFRKWLNRFWPKRRMAKASSITRP